MPVENVVSIFSCLDIIRHVSSCDFFYSHLSDIWRRGRGNSWEHKIKIKISNRICSHYCYYCFKCLESRVLSSLLADSSRLSARADVYYQYSRIDIQVFFSWLKRHFCIRRVFRIDKLYQKIFLLFFCDKIVA